MSINNNYNIKKLSTWGEKKRGEREGGKLTEGGREREGGGRKREGGSKRGGREGGYHVMSYDVAYDIT